MKKKNNEIKVVKEISPATSKIHLTLHKPEECRPQSLPCRVNKSVYKFVCTDEQAFESLKRKFF